MKNKSLAFQIWAVFSGILIVISLLLLILFPTTLRDFFTKEIYKTIENQQLLLLDYMNTGSYPFFENGKKQGQSVSHLGIPLYDQFIDEDNPELSREFIRQTQELAQLQSRSVARYEKNLDNQTLFFVIRKDISYKGVDYYILSYSWDTYRNDLVYTLFRQLMIVMFFVFILSWIPSIWLARYLSKPLVKLEKHVKKFSEQEWYEPVEVDRNDEIGRLGHTIEKMRQHLIRKDEAQQTLLQNISHDLKTPVMVIRGYAQSVNDGIFPKGDLTSTMDVIEEESEKLEKKIKDLLYLTKLDFLSTRKPLKADFSLDQLIYEEVDRIKWAKPELNWDLNLEEATILGDAEQWEKLIENLLENSLRYAKTIISISITKSQDKFVLRFWNDGPMLDEALKDKLFEPFEKGQNGEFGIGLSIVKRIANIHGANVWAENEDDGAAFYVEIPNIESPVKRS
ncbi:two-component sensor histidine kinase [Bacillus sp. 7586-K]|uniref:histidine kinase n=1 Tax=Metabacillus niabensis TaxID=324854 RepID=A0ABT9Z083_9BACI|nr:HAMP domain-containing sensor histidine kinase [Metabacillus niabensis]MDQ0225435.1 two-component system sensor histidine kinase CssS [Metabacillus niabensis]PAD71006.1 two-component sensor histidine kinase [Bacillus sp. 7586-K]